MSFFRSLVLSVSSPKYYDVILRSPMSRAWRYFTYVHLWMALLFCVPLTTFLLFLSPQELTNRISVVFPADLVITIETGALTVNQELPYAIAFPPEFEQDMGADQDHPANIIVFTNEEGMGSFTDFLGYDSFVVATERAVYVRDRNEQMRAFLMPEDGAKVVIDRPLVDEGIAKFLSNPFIRYRLYIIPIALIVFIFMFVTLFIGHAILLLIYTAIVWLLAKLFLRASRYSYGTLYHVGMHSLTLILIADLVFAFFGLTFFHTFVRLLAYLAWTMWILTEIDGTTHHVHATHSHDHPKKKATRTHKR